MGGAEKAFLDLGGRPLIQHIIECLRPQTGAIIISANGDTVRFDKFGCEIVPDGLGAGETPLAGLAAVLAHAEINGFDAVVSVPSDTPFLPEDLVARLSGVGAAIASSKSQDHYLTGLWPVSLAGVLMTALVSRDLVRMQHWVALSNARRVEWSVSGIDPFFNINTLEDLEHARSWLKPKG